MRPGCRYQPATNLNEPRIFQKSGESSIMSLLFAFARIDSPNDSTEWRTWRHFINSAEVSQSAYRRLRLYQIPGLYRIRHKGAGEDIGCWRLPRFARGTQALYLRKLGWDANHHGAQATPAGMRRSRNCRSSRVIIWTEFPDTRLHGFDAMIFAAGADITRLPGGDLTNPRILLPL